MKDIDKKKFLLKLKLKIYVINFAVLGVALFSSEFLASIFNNKLDLADASFIYRVGFAFKPTVIGVYIVSVIILNIITYLYLKPMFRYFSKGTDYEKARVSTVRLPWALIIFQIVIWFIGTTAYFVIKKWVPDGGIPYGWVLFLKMGTAIIAAVYSALIINVLLMKPRKLLNMIDIRKGENDFFARNKDLIGIISVVIYTLSVLGHIIFYYSNGTHPSDPNHLLIGFIIVGVFLLIISVVLGYFSRQQTLYPIKILEKSLAGFSKGQADLSKRIVLIHFDEIGELVYGYNMFMDNLNKDFLELKNLVVKMHNLAHSVSQSSQDLASSTEEQASGTEEISSTMKDFTNAMNYILTSINNQTEIASRNTQKAIALSNDFKTIIGTAKLINGKSVDNLDSAKKGAEIINISMETNIKINDNLRNMTSKMEEVGKQTKNIDEILKSIQDIADRTNILAMNASIEAAHAGEAGKGFAIVAMEIRSLAETTAKSVQSIADLIEYIKKSVGEAVDIFRLNEKQADESSKLAKDAESALSSIVSNVQTAADMMREIGSITQNQEDAVSRLVEETRNLAKAFDENKATIESQAENARQINSSLGLLAESFEGNAVSSDNLSNLAVALDDMSKNITKIVEQFKIVEVNGEQV
jgi:methyl-accepting chemotaxis protein